MAEPEWKKRHREEQERRAKEEKELQAQEDAERIRIIAEKRSQEEAAEKARLAQIERARQEEAARELADKEAEAERKKQMFSGAAAKAARDEILKGASATGSKKFTPTGTSVAAHTPEKKEDKVVSPRKDGPAASGNIPAWKLKQMEEEERRKKAQEEESRKKAEAISHLPPVYEIKKIDQSPENY